MNLKWCMALSCVLLGATPADENVLEIYDVRDLAEREQRVPGEDPLKFLSFVLAHEVLDPKADVDIEAANGAIVLRAPAAQHAQVKAFFAQIRARSDRTTRVMIEILQFDAERLAEVSPDGEPVVLKGGTLLLANGSTLSPPAIVHPLERGQVANIKQVPCVVAYRAFERLRPLIGRVIVPVVDEIHTGQTLDVITAPLDSKRCVLRLHAEDTTLVEPVPSVETDLGPVAVPETHVATVDSTLTLSQGEHALLPIPGAGKERQAFLVRLWMQ